MDAIFFVNHQGKQVIPSPQLFNKALGMCKPEIVILPTSWIGFDIGGMPSSVANIFVDAEDAQDSVWEERSVVICRSRKMLSKALRAPTAAINGVAYKVWKKGFGVVSSVPQKTIVVITQGEVDPLPEDPVFCELGIPAKDIFFILESQLIGNNPDEQ